MWLQKVYHSVNITFHSIKWLLCSSSILVFFLTIQLICNVCSKMNQLHINISIFFFIFISIMVYHHRILNIAPLYSTWSCLNRSSDRLCSYLQKHFPCLEDPPFNTICFPNCSLLFNIHKVFKVSSSDSEMN